MKFWGLLALLLTMIAALGIVAFLYFTTAGTEQHGGTSEGRSDALDTIVKEVRPALGKVSRAGVAQTDAA